MHDQSLFADGELKKVVIGLFLFWKQMRGRKDNLHHEWQHFSFIVGDERERERREEKRREEKRREELEISREPEISGGRIMKGYSFWLQQLTLNIINCFSY